MSYKVIKDSRRKKLVLTVEKDGTVVIKAPKWTRKSTIDRFYNANLGWIQQRKQQISTESGNYIHLSENDINKLRADARNIMSLKTARYAEIMGVACDGIKITSARKRWGSCRRQADRYTICYSWRTMLLPDRRQDYVVVHELAHIKQFNHSKEFYTEIEKVLPDWKNLEKQVDTFKDIYLY